MEPRPCVVCGRTAPDEEAVVVIDYVIASPDGSEAAVCSLRCMVRHMELEEIALTATAMLEQGAE